MTFRIFLLSCFLIICYSFSVTQAKVYASRICQIDTVKVILDIKKHYSDIVSDKIKYTQYKKNIFGESSEGETVIAYYDISDLKKIVKIRYGEMGKIVTEYYFNNNSLFFIFRSDYQYNKPFYLKDSKVTFIRENRYYFYNSSLVRWIDENKSLINPNSSHFKNEESILLGEVKETLGICNQP